MSEPSPECLACRIARGEHRPAGGTVWRGDGLVVHGFADPSPLAGWLVIASERHVRALYDLPDPEAQALGPLAARVMRAQREALGAEHVYALALGDVLHHFHLHLVPRYPDTPDRLRGRRCFDALPGDALPAQALEAACRAVEAALAVSGAPGSPRPAPGAGR